MLSGPIDAIRSFVCSYWITQQWHETDKHWMSWKWYQMKKIRCNPRPWSQTRRSLLC